MFTDTVLLRQSIMDAMSFHCGLVIVQVAPECQVEFYDLFDDTDYAKFERLLEYLGYDIVLVVS